MRDEKPARVRHSGPEKLGAGKAWACTRSREQPRQRSGAVELPDTVVALVKQEGTTKVNQCLRPLQPSTDSNLADLGRYGAGLTASLWKDLSLRSQADGCREAAEKTVMYLWRCRRGVAECLTCSMVRSERGNHGGLARAPSGEGQAHGRLRRPPWGGVPVVVRGRESRPHGEGGQRFAGGEGGRR